MERIEQDGAALSLFRDAPSHAGLKSAAISDFEFASAIAGARLLTKVEATLHEDDFEAVIAPMQGDTWHSYRVIIESDGSAPFPMEPVSGRHDLAALQLSNFEVIETYVSTSAPLDRVIDSPASVPDGIMIEPWDGQDAPRLLHLLYQMSLRAFANNPLYKPIGEDAFYANYEPLIGALDPRFIFFARDADGALQGFLLAYPDPTPRPNGPAIVLKTYASQRRGLGYALADRLHRVAQEHGFVSVIHALMHESNVSRLRSEQHNTSIMRRYALMAKRLK